MARYSESDPQTIYTGTGKQGRPSPRTVGETVDPETGETTYFAKFGTQQLKFIDPAKPALGVTQVNVGQSFKGFTTGLVREITGQQHPFGTPTVRNTAYPDMTITKTVGTTTPPPFNGNGNGTGCECEACKDGTGVCSDKNPKCNAWDIGCEWFGAPDKHGCECQACKDGTGQCSDKVPQCDAWDLLCEGTGGASEGIVGGTDVWLWVKIILVLIGIGILLWLLRPLFGIAKNITET